MTTKRGQKQFRCVRTRTASAVTEMFILLWTAPPHTGLTDLFLTQVRKAYDLEQEKKPSVRDALGKASVQPAQTTAKTHKGQER